MAVTINKFISAMLILGLLIMFTLDFTVAQIGVGYGRLGDGLPAASEVVRLYKKNNIQRMIIYDPDKPILQALGGSNIEVTLGVPNTNLPNLASNQDNANTWVQNYVRNYPNVRFRCITVGNEVSPLRKDTSQYVPFVLPAMQNVYKAISTAGLANQIRVSTTIETGVLAKNYPPGDGVFRSDVTPYLNPIIQFLVNKNAPLFVNIYPYFAYINDKRIDLNYALFKSDGIVVPGGIRYQNLFYAMLDAMYAALEKSDAMLAALEKSGGASLKIAVSETGWPSNGGDTTSADYARIYNTNLIQRVKTGTPKRPGQPIETYIFAMFDENQKKGPEYEKHFGIFLPNGQPKYPINFN